MNKSISKIFAHPSETIKTVLERLTRNKSQDPSLPPGIALIVGKKNLLLGVATNGDLRRAFAAGVKLEDPISKAMNKKPSVIVSQGPSADVLSILFEKIRAGEWPKNRLEKILVVDREKRVLDLVSFYDLVHKSDVRFKHLGVVGLGYIGLTLALTLADLGFKVKGLDVDWEVKRSLGKGRAHFYEEGLQELLEDHLGKNFVLVNDFRSANNCDLYVIAVGTPLSKNLRPDLSSLERAARNIGKVLKPGDAVVLRSTVPVGTTRNVVIPILEGTSGLKGGEDFLVAFAPERTVQGKALEELRRLPQVVGGINHASSDLVSNIFGLMTSSIVLVDSLEASEMVKLVNNTYRDVTFAFANEVSLIARRWGIDTKKVVEAANYGYERSHVPYPSPGVGGYCLEKDPYILIESARSKNYEPLLPAQARKLSTTMMDFVAGRIVSFLRKQKKSNPKILLLGIAFKGRPVTSDVRGSPTLQLAGHLRKEGFSNLYGYDPAVRRQDATAHHIRFVAKKEEGFRNADSVVVMNNNPHFESLDMRALLKLAHNPVLFFDGWSMYNPEEVRKTKGVFYERL